MTPPLGCRWCGVPEREHAQRWHPAASWHGWTEPDREQIRQRMRANRGLPLEPADRHLLIAVTVHPDGSQSSRIWPMPADRLEHTVAHLGTPAHRTHIAADQIDTDAVRRISDASLVVDGRAAR